MKNLLEKARDEEADAELHQYESDDDEEVSASCPCIYLVMCLSNEYCTQLHCKLVRGTSGDIN